MNCGTSASLRLSGIRLLSTTHLCFTPWTKDSLSLHQMAKSICGSEGGAEHECEQIGQVCRGWDRIAANHLSGRIFPVSPHRTSTISVPVGDDMAIQIKKGT